MKPNHPIPLTAILFFATTLTASAEFNLGKAIQKGIDISRQPGHSVSPTPPRKFEPRPYPISQPKPAPVPKPIYQPKPAPVPKTPAPMNSAGMVSVLRGNSISSSSKPVISNRTAQIAPQEMPKGYEVFRMKQGRDRAEGLSSPPPQTTFVKDGRPSPAGERTPPPTSIADSGGRPTPSAPPASLSYRVDANSKLATSSVRFRKGSTDLADDASYQYLLNLSTALRDPSLLGDRFVVEGHASADGSEYSNFLLSQRRANAIYEFLMSQGVSPDRLLSVGHGESQARFRPGDPEYLLAQDRQVMVFKLAD